MEKEKIKKEIILTRMLEIEAWLEVETDKKEIKEFKKEYKKLEKMLKEMENC